jgi:hypothetical protein
LKLKHFSGALEVGQFIRPCTYIIIRLELDEGWDMMFNATFNNILDISWQSSSVKLDICCIFLNKQ